MLHYVKVLCVLVMVLLCWAVVPLTIAHACIDPHAIVCITQGTGSSSPPAQGGESKSTTPAESGNGGYNPFDSGTGFTACVAAGGQQATSFRCISPPGSPGLTFGGYDPYQIALALYAQIPAPPVVIRSSPGNAGLVALPTWWWLTGYDGGKLTANASRSYEAITGQHCIRYRQDGLGNQLLGPDGQPICAEYAPDYEGHTLTVALTCLPAGWHWNFGDTGPREGQQNELDTGPADLGQPYPPGPSDISYTYQHSSSSGSARTALPGGTITPAYQVTVSGIWNCSYRATDNGKQIAGGTLGQAIRTYVTNYAVYQARAVITGPNGAGEGGQ